MDRTEYFIEVLSRGPFYKGQWRKWTDTGYSSIEAAREHRDDLRARRETMPQSVAYGDERIVKRTTREEVVQ